MQAFAFLSLLRDQALRIWRESSAERMQAHYRGEVVRIAQSSVGQKETDGRNRSPFLDRMIREAGGEIGDEYCFLFAFWAHQKAAKLYSGKTSLRGSRAAIKGWVVNESCCRQVTPGEIAEGNIQPGDVFIRVRGTPPFASQVERALDSSLRPEDRWQAGHAGLVVSSPYGGVVETIEGNSSSRADGIYMRELNLEDPRLVGLIRPIWEQKT